MNIEQMSSKEKGSSKLMKAGRAITLAFMITAATLAAKESAIASTVEVGSPDDTEKAGKDESFKLRQEIVKAATELSVKYPVIIEYIGEYNVGHSVKISYKGESGLEKHELTIPNNEDVNSKYLLEEVVKRLINPDQDFEEINLEKISLSEDVKDYLDKNNIELKGNDIIISIGKMALLDVADVNFSTDGKILTIEIENNDGSKETHHMKDDNFID